MKRNVIILFVTIVTQLQAQNNFTQFVNPMIGTGGHGHTFPGATMPFAMVQLSPDTRIDGSWDGCSGYHYSDSIIYGFSHTHLSGTGCSDYGDIAFMPTFTIGKLQEQIQNIENLSQKFSHQNEVSKAGYYSVKLDNGIKVELTSTTRVGFQQYTYSQNGYAWITLNLKHRDELLEGKINEINKHTFSGLRRSKAWAEDQLLYYYFEVNKDADQIIISKNEKGETKVNLGYKVKAGDKIIIKTALSSVDVAGAKANMEDELPHFNFEKVKQDANKAWNTELNRIKAYGGTQTEKINFYTALYHCMIHPNIMNDADGRYRGRDKQIHKAEGFNYYTVFSLWDTYRALHPLLNIIDKKRSYDFMMTFKAQYEQSGRLPMWELWGNETNCMIGFHSVSVILDAYNKEVITLQELKDLYPAVKAEAMSNRFGLDKFREKGFLSIEDESESVSKTLEYSYDFYCVAEIAKRLESFDDEYYFGKLSHGWQNVYNTKTGFMTPRKNGGWLQPFDPTQVNNHYTEANSWQYSFAVPQDYYLIANESKTSQLFNTDSKTTGREQADITGLIGQYAHGNEPSHHIPYLFNNIDSTSKYVKKICNELYKPTPDGLCGNEDCGQMSAWYVFSAMGFYPVNPSTNDYYFGNMIFDSIDINFNDTISKIYKIESLSNNVDKSLDIKSKVFSFTNQQNFRIFGKGKLSSRIRFSKQFTVYDLITYVSSPIIVSNFNIFKDSIFIVLLSNHKNYDDTLSKIKYQLNGDTILEYTKPINISKSTKITAFEGFENILSNTYIVSDTSTAYLHKKPNNYSIKINSTYNKQYTADGYEGIIDGLMGDTDWRKGRWQGYQNQDFEAVIDMKEVKQFSEISANFLQDTRSWIIMPNAVEFYISNDSINYTLLKTSNNIIAANDYKVQTQKFVCANFNRNIKILPSNQKREIMLSLSARYIKIVATNYGILPSWHQGAGGNAFIFIDEIEIK